MNVHLTPSEDISLQHVLENGLAVLCDEGISAARRARTLDSLSRIFSEAGSGSRALLPQNSLFGVEQRPALERFTLFFKYLHRDFGEQLSMRLQEATEVFANLKDNRNPDAAARERAKELIERLLSAFDEERSLSPLEPPRFFVDTLS